MEIIRDFGLVLLRPLALIQRYRSAPKVLLATLLTALACVLNAIAAPLAGALLASDNPGAPFSAGSILLKLAVCGASVALACLVFKVLALVFHKEVSVKLIFATWGVTYVPTLLCMAVVEASERAFLLFIGNTWLGLALCTFLVLLLAWKAIYFFIEANVVLGLKGGQTVIAVLVTGVVYLLIMMMNFWAGLKVPML